MSGGGSSSPQPQQVTQTTSNIPEYARQYFEDIMGRAQGLSNQQYIKYPGQRIEDFNANQTKTQQDFMGLQAPVEFGEATYLSSNAGLGALDAAKAYNPQQVSAQQVSAQHYDAPLMQAAQTDYDRQATAERAQAAQVNYNPNLTNFQMGPAQTFGQDQAQQYMSPYFQNVVDTQKREAITDAKKAQLTQNLGAARQGTYGGSRQLLATTERERALGQQLGDIQGRGLQSAYDNAQQQFERDRAAGYNVNQANQQAGLGVQQLGTQTGLQAALANQSAEQQTGLANQSTGLQASLANQSTGMQVALANLNADQQARVQNQAAQLQTQGLNAQQAMQAALANQSSGLQASLANQQADQFGAGYRLQGYAQANQSGQTLGNLGTSRQQADLSRLGAQQQVGAQQQALAQQYKDQQYADFLRQRDYPMEQLGYYSNLLRGLPIGLNSTTTTYGQSPSIGSQIAGAGLGAASLYNLAKGG